MTVGTRVRVVRLIFFRLTHSTLPCLLSCASSIFFRYPLASAAACSPVSIHWAPDSYVPGVFSTFRLPGKLLQTHTHAPIATISFLVKYHFICQPPTHTISPPHHSIITNNNTTLLSGLVSSLTINIAISSSLLTPYPFRYSARSLTAPCRR